MPRPPLRLAAFLGLISTSALAAPADPRAQPGFDVVIAGGTTAAFAAAIAAAEAGATTALLEPTDWVGGQLTSSGVPAVDEAWHRHVDSKSKAVVLDVSKIARDRANMTPNFRAMLDATGNPGGGWVSNYCFEPRKFLEAQLLPHEARLKGKLTVYRDTVVKRIVVADGLVRDVVAIRRTPRAGVADGGYDRLPSDDLPDWYRAEPSARFDKEVLAFPIAEAAGRRTVYIDATDWGDLLALSGARYLQGVEEVDGGVDGDDACGQSTVYGFIERLEAAPRAEDPGVRPERLGEVAPLGFGGYSGRPDAWAKIWTYRRVRGHGPEPAVGDLSLQNWGYSAKAGDGGNDYPLGYLFKPRAEADEDRARDAWSGGLDLDVLAATERRAFAWHEWFRAHPPGDSGIAPGQVTLDRSAFGTGHGLSKLPYVRDTRRSIGLDGFILKYADIAGDPARLTGTRFRDRVALGAYPADIHPLIDRKYPGYISDHPETLPFVIPFRALTHHACGNLLVAGKTMAQSFLVNAATRLHPIEWSTGTAAGVAAASMAQSGRTSRQALEHIEEWRDLVRAKTPIDWTIDGKVLLPGPGD